MSFGFSSNIRPVYSAKDSVGLTSIPVDRVLFSEKQISAELITDTISGDLPFTGKHAGLIINFTHPNLPNISESFECSGILQSKSLGCSSNGLLQNSISISQYNPLSLPSITGVDPSTAEVNSYFRVSGKNLTYTNTISFGNDVFSPFVDIYDSTLISGRVHIDARTGPIKVNTQAGSVTGQVFTVTYPQVEITGLIPPTGKIGATIMVKGTNFYNISHVKFSSGLAGSGYAKFQKVDRETMFVNVPQDTIWDYIQAINSGSNSGISSQKFVPIYVINTIDPQTGTSGTPITISGHYFNGVSGVNFNGIAVTGFSTVSSNVITTYVPSGWTKGYLNMSGLSGINVYSPVTFSPHAFITGISPLSGTGAGVVRISGVNFTTGFLSSFQTNTFKANFNGAITGLYISSQTLLTGLCPKKFTTGPVRLYEPDGATLYPSNITFSKVYDPPIIHRVYPRFGYSGSGVTVTIEGENFYYLSNINWSGLQPANAMNQFTGTSSNCTILVDRLGKKVIATNVQTTGRRTGDYLIEIVTSQGKVYPTGNLMSGFIIYKSGTTLGV